jgi:methylamine--corrinoid protein Co-methyltransferase
MTRSQANEIALKLLERYEDQIADAPKGRPFQECYDARTARPMPWYLDLYEKVKDNVAAMGVEFPY